MTRRKRLTPAEAIDRSLRDILGAPGRGASVARLSYLYAEIARDLPATLERFGWRLVPTEDDRP
jgi:hypothetical protein